MKAVVAAGAGGPEVLRIEEVPSPPLGRGEIRIAVVATSVNRADLLQRRGLYPPLPGHSSILGLECAGHVLEIGQQVDGWMVGDRVMALLPGGGYAEEVVVDARHALPIPSVLTTEEAGGVMQVFLTADSNLFGVARLSRGECCLIHGGGSGVGTAAMALLRESGVRFFVTAGSGDRCLRCRGLGAELAINYRTEEFVQSVNQATQGIGTNIILDCMGGAYLNRNLAALAPGGRLVIIGLMGGGTAALDLTRLLSKRLQVIGSVLRSQSSENKAQIVQDFRRRFGDALDQGRLRPVVDRVFSIAQISDAHRWVETKAHFGKVIVTI